MCCYLRIYCSYEFPVGQQRSISRWYVGCVVFEWFDLCWPRASGRRSALARRADDNLHRSDSSPRRISPNLGCFGSGRVHGATWSISGSRSHYVRYDMLRLSSCVYRVFELIRVVPTLNACCRTRLMNFYRYPDERDVWDIRECKYDVCACQRGNRLYTAQREKSSVSLCSRRRNIE